MLWFIGIMLAIFIGLFIALVLTEKLKQREEVDPEFSARMDIWRKKWAPKITFFENLFMWLFAFYMIYLFLK